MDATFCGFSTTTTAAGSKRSVGYVATPARPTVVTRVMQLIFTAVAASTSTGKKEKSPTRK